MTSSHLKSSISTRGRRICRARSMPASLISSRHGARIFRWDRKVSICLTRKMAGRGNSLAPVAAHGSVKRRGRFYVISPRPLRLLLNRSVKTPPSGGVFCLMGAAFIPQHRQFCRPPVSRNCPETRLPRTHLPMCPASKLWNTPLRGSRRSWCVRRRSA